MAKHKLAGLRRRVLGGLVAVGDGRIAPRHLALSCHEERPVGSPRFRMAAASDFAMNFGMFWMSTGLMTPLLPFFALLAF